jgi:pimeloyl-ACP methyl ester carboxylesterase
MSVATRSRHARRRRLACLAVATAVAATGCTSTGGGHTGASPQPATAGGTSPITWGPCPADYFVTDPNKSFDRDQVDCTTIDVPAVYGQDSGLPAFGLALMRIRATGAGNPATLFVNPGGPGESGINEIQQQKYPAAIREAYDVVGFDPRGVLHSQPVSGNPIRCSDQLDFASYWTGEDTPDDQEQVDQIRQLLDDYQADCESHNPAWWTLGTDNVVRDLDAMRKRLTGNAGLNFLGSSYGTTIASEYLRLFPQHNSHIVLDSPTNDAADTDASMLGQTRSIDQHLLRLVDGYAKAKGLSRSEVESELRMIRQWGDDDELLGYAGLKPATDGSNNRLSTEYLFNRGLLALTYYDSRMAQHAFNEGIDALLRHHWNGYFEYLALRMDGYDTTQMYTAYQNGEPYDPQGYTRDNSFEIREMVNGIDVDQRDRRTHAQQDALSRKVRSAGPLLWSLDHDSTNFTYYEDHGGNQWSWAAFEDPNIPDPPRHRPPRTNTSGRPVMVIGSRWESTTPYPYAVRTAEDLSRYSSRGTAMNMRHWPASGMCA